MEGRALRIRAGTCGWAFADWKGVLYPRGVQDELSHYASVFDTVEIDSTWYRIPSAKTVEGWRSKTPEGFVFCPKMPGEITHERLLVGVQEPLARFLEAIALLGDKLGPMVVQLSPQFTADGLDTLEQFLRSLPAEHRFAVEFRHRTWLAEPRALELLRELRMAVVMADHPWYPRIEQVTADFAYVRLLGRRGVFPDFSRIHRPRDDSLAHWADVLRSLPEGVRQAFVLVNNQFEGHSPRSVQRLLTLLDPGSAPRLPEPGDGGWRQLSLLEGT